MLYCEVALHVSELPCVSFYRLQLVAVMGGNCTNLGESEKEETTSLKNSQGSFFFLLYQQL